MHAYAYSLPIFAAACLASARSTVSLDDLGPIAIAPDGAMSRISNWDELTENERAAARRALSRRNAKRLAKLKEEQEQSQRKGGGKPSTLFASLASRLDAVIRHFKRLLARVLRRPHACASKANTTSLNSNHTMDFAPEFIEPIISGRKQATTRLISAEPHLGELKAGDRFLATCIKCSHTSSSEGEFARLDLLRIDQVEFVGIDDELASIEGMGDADELRSALLRFYPDLDSDALLSVFHFQLVGENTSTQLAT